MTRSFSLFTLLSLATTALTPAIASDNTSGSQRGTYSPVEEIVVTALKREQRILDVPMSVSAVSGESLVQNKIFSSKELERFVPNIVYKQGITAASATFSIRGIGGGSLTNFEPSVGTVVDGVVYAATSMGLFDFNDVERIEVLRGPQGTLFGMNSSAGVVNIITKEPTKDFAGDFGVSYGTYHDAQVHGSASGPLFGNDTLRARLSFYVRNRDGYLNNIYNGANFNDQNEWGLRGKIVYEPTASTKITLTSDVGRSKPHCCIAAFDSFTPLATPLDHTYFDSLVGKKAKTNVLGDVVDKFRYAGGSLQIDQSVGDYKLTSITGYRETKADTDYHISPTPTPFLLTNHNPVHREQVSEELRVASPIGGTVDFVAGGFFFTEKNDLVYNQLITIGALRLTNQNTLNAKTTNIAGFGEANIHLSDKLTLIAGARLTHFKLTSTETGMPVPAGTIPLSVPAGQVVKVDAGLNKVSWRGGAQWKFANHNMVYATAARGYKGPAENTAVSSPVIYRVARPEQATSYELGWKGQTADGRVSGGLTAFFTDFNGFQATASVTGTIPGSYLLNAGKLRTKGVELELNANLIEGLNVTMTGAYLDATFKEFPNAPCNLLQNAGLLPGCTTVGSVKFQNLAGARLPAAPKWSTNISADYRFPIPHAPLNGFLNLNFSWRSSVQWNLDQNPNTIEPGYGLLGASLGVSDRDDRYKLSVFAKNLTNKNYGQLAVNARTGIVTRFIPSDYQRTFGVSLDAKF